MPKIHFIFLLLSLAGATFAQKNKASKTEEKAWDVNAPGTPSKNVQFTLDEGTWMNLDLSPDGKKITFDLLGDIYIMDVTGGDAVCLRSGYAYEVQPRFSPDGQWISFTSDAGGADNIWMMRSDGSQAKQITKLLVVQVATLTHTQLLLVEVEQEVLMAEMVLLDLHKVAVVVVLAVLVIPVLQQHQMVEQERLHTHLGESRLELVY